MTAPETAAPAASHVRGGGVLAIWNDCAPDRLAAYEDWYLREHLAERLSIPGFLRGRRYDALTPGPGFFTCYDVTSPSVLTSPAYRARLDAPTPATEEMMRHAFSNISRTICERSTLRQGPSGGCCVAVRTDDSSAARSIADDLDDPALCRADLSSAQDHDVPLSTEEKLRGGDARIRACLFVEVCRPKDAERLARVTGGQAFQLVTEMLSLRQEAEP